VIRNRTLALVSVVYLASGAALASDPIGVYALIDRVTLEPPAATGPAERVQVQGAFALARRVGIGDVYDPPVTGYLYYSLPPGEETLARIEWNDLASVAGTGQIVAFGSRYMPSGSVRSGCETPGAPDVYPIAMGVTRVGAKTDYPPIVSLLSLPGPMAPADGDGVAAGATVTFTARNILAADHPEALYLFEVRDRRGVVESSPAISAGEQATSWTASFAVRPGERYTWRVQAAGGGWSGAPATACFQHLFARGDANDDGSIDIADAVSVLLYLFAGSAVVEKSASDIDGNGSLEVTDSIYLLQYLFTGGPAPPPPFPEPGLTAAD
jgi:hypothetical protein